jgi:hypothetical protein
MGDQSIGVRTCRTTRTLSASSALSVERSIDADRPDGQDTPLRGVSVRPVSARTQGGTGARLYKFFWHTAFYAAGLMRTGRARTHGPAPLVDAPSGHKWSGVGARAARISGLPNGKFRLGGGTLQRL